MAVVFCGHAEIQANRLGMANMQKAVRFWRKSRHHLAVMLTARDIIVDDYPLLPVRRRFWEHVLRAVDVLSSDTSRADLFELGLSAKSAGKPDEARDYLSFALLQTPPSDVEWTQRIEQALATVATKE